MTNRELAKLIQLAVKTAVREELKPIKAALNELKKGPTVSGKSLEQAVNRKHSNNLTEIQKGFRQKHQVSRPTRQYSNDPMLNELLQSTDPVPNEELGYLDMFEEDEQIVNLPTTETGRPINAPKAVIEAMNRDYSGMFKKEETVVKKAPAPNNNFRAAIINRMEGFEPDMNGSFDDEEEDFSFLDNVG